MRVSAFGASLLALTLAGCGGGSLGSGDGGADGGAQLSLDALVQPLSLAGLVVTEGEIELEHLGLYGNDDDDDDNDTSVHQLTLSFATPQQDFTFPSASPGLYSRLSTGIDHIRIDGTWRGTPITVQTFGVERTVDLGTAGNQLSSTQSVSFTLTIHASTWLTADILDSAPVGPGGIEIDAETSPTLVDQIMAWVQMSFSLSSS